MRDSPASHFEYVFIMKQWHNADRRGNIAHKPQTTIWVFLCLLLKSYTINIRHLIYEQENLLLLFMCAWISVINMTCKPQYLHNRSLQGTQNNVDQQKNWDKKRSTLNKNILKTLHLSTLEALQDIWDPSSQILFLPFKLALLKRKKHSCSREN